MTILELIYIKLKVFSKIQLSVLRTKSRPSLHILNKLCDWSRKTRTILTTNQIQG